MPWNKGIPHSGETKRKMKLARVGRKPALGKRWKIKDTSRMNVADQRGSKNPMWGETSIAGES